MNGCIASSTLLDRRLLAAIPNLFLLIPKVRSLLLIVCCAMSLAMLGAVRARSVNRPLSVAPVGEWSAEWSDDHFDDSTDDKSDDKAAPLGALNEPAQRTLESAVLPAPVELLRASIPTVASRPAVAVAGPKLRTMVMEVTAYCACKKCCGPRAQGLTASGRRIDYNGGRFVAADTRLLKFNTKLLIPGYAAGQPVPVIDRGGAIKGAKLDVFFDSHEQARKWGRQWLVVTVME